MALVYRVEHKERKIGPYQEGGQFSKRDKLDYSHFDHFLHPTPIIEIQESARESGGAELNTE